MPPWENVAAQVRTCTQCGSEFETKRPAKYCSAPCRNRARPSRPYNAEVRRRNYQKRMQDPDRKALHNAAANTRAREVKAWIANYKTSLGCIDCGYSKHPAALDIDHMQGKTANVSSLKSVAAVRAEIARHACVVRCANCHRIKSWETRTWERHEFSSISS